MLRRYTDVCSECEEADWIAAETKKKDASYAQQAAVQNTERSLEGILLELDSSGAPLYRRRIIIGERRKLLGGGVHREWEDVEGAYDIGLAEWDVRETSSSGPQRMLETGVTKAGEVVWLGIPTKHKWGDVSKVYPTPATRDPVEAWTKSGGEPRRCRLSRNEIVKRLEALAPTSRKHSKRVENDNERAELAAAQRSSVEQSAAESHRDVSGPAVEASADAQHARFVYCTGCRRKMAVSGRGKISCASCGTTFEV